ncbi:hypothetical protein BBAD15_g7557 [Beauveria bassiana D1-5]|uniref:Uncharacterized protein n=1 Tax=Beauveria bassiana D1-5 TaxID=1245745 RepID=A0A0A2W2B4_BEABA|nr:hypothetical protein BBAD15_g7557 [Beauveria bassiana D1-5]
MALHRKRILIVPRHAVSLGHILRRQPHGHDAVADILLLRAPQRRPHVLRHRATPIVARHALHARGDARAYGAGADIRRDGRNGLQRRRARAVHRVQRRADGEARVVEGHARGL